MNDFQYALLFAIPGFLVLMLIEYSWGLIKGHNTWQNQSDAIASISSGLTYVCLSGLNIGLLVISYELLHNWIAPAEIELRGAWLWLLVFIWTDFVGYWIHRWAHANSFLWAMHMIHHSSEEFNLAVALRQNAFQWFSYGGVMLLPLLLIGVPVEVVAIVAPIHLFMQFWYHTRHIDKLGILEYVLVTPSQHRVHHAINPRYIDKNFGQIFCWDRLFGTFQEELASDPPAYGITTPVRSYNPMIIELAYMGRLIRDAISTQSWGSKLRVFFSQTGWRPDDSAQRWPLKKYDYLDASQKYAPINAPRQIVWGWVQLGLTVALTAYLLIFMERIPSGVQYSIFALILLGIFANTEQLMNHSTTLVDAARLALIIGIFVRHPGVYGFLCESLVGLGVATSVIVVSLWGSFRRDINSSLQGAPSA